jgi:AraC-like DNA-binding protein
MELHTIGLNIRHTGNFSIDRPHGSGDYLLIVFKTNALLTIDKQEIMVSPDSCILYNRDSKQLYGTCGRTYVNHYIHFECYEEGFITQKGIPFDTPFLLLNPMEIEELLKMISREQISSSLCKTENIDLLLKLLLLKISDNVSYSNVQTVNIQHHEELTNLRAEIYSNAGQYNSIKELAKKMNLSISHFQMIYHTKFGISCYDDLLTAKVMSAQHHLSYTALSIKEIALLCGYENDTCFMRIFKQRTGMTPTQYRNKLINR